MILRIEGVVDFISILPFYFPSGSKIIFPQVRLGSTCFPIPSDLYEIQVEAKVMACSSPLSWP